MKREKLIQLCRFGIVGTVGFAVDSAVLYLLRHALGLYGARMVSFLAAVFATWLLNRIWTFRMRHSSLRKHHEFALYLGLMLIGGCINYAAYATCLHLLPLTVRFPVLAVAIGSLAGMGANLMAMRYIVFRHQSR